MKAYEDMLARERPQAPSPMSRANRAAQFAPFAALTGLDEALFEQARLTQRRVPLSDEEQAALNQTTRLLCETSDTHPTVTFLCFEEDATKEGGRYLTVTGRLRAVDEVGGVWILDDRRRVPFAAVCAIAVTTPP